MQSCAFLNTIFDEWVRRDVVWVRHPTSLTDQALLPQPPAVEPPADTRRRKGREAP